MNPYSLPSYPYQSKRCVYRAPFKEGEWNSIMDVEGAGLIKHIWITFPTGDMEYGRQNILRMYWDDEPNPSVEAPLLDFFGIPFGMVKPDLQINSYFISVLPKSGLNCYFTMPFAKRVRVELFVQKLHDKFKENGFYFQADYEACPEGLPPSWEHLRFHAKYRMESPTEIHGHRYLTLDAEGEGYLIGTTYGIQRSKEQPDAWFHGGGDQVLIDGESRPDLLHGIGAEDYFAHAWGTNQSNALYAGNPYIKRTIGSPDLKLALYRFFVHDPIKFTTSIRHSLGAMGDAISSVAYWYQTEPHREFFKLPDKEHLMQASHVPRLSHDIEPAYGHTWNVFGPIQDEAPHAFEVDHPLEEKLDWSYTEEYDVPEVPSKVTMTAKWQQLEAPRGFLDFNIFTRPAVRTIRFQTECYGFALGYIDLDEELDACLRVAYDDKLRLRVNGEVLLDQEHMDGFEAATLPIALKKGRNELLVKLSNTRNTNYKSWVLHLSIVDQHDRLMNDVRVTDR